MKTKSFMVGLAMIVAFATAFAAAPGVAFADGPKTTKTSAPAKPPTTPKVNLAPSNTANSSATLRQPSSYSPSVSTSAGCGFEAKPVARCQVTVGPSVSCGAGCQAGVSVGVGFRAGPGTTMTDPFGASCGIGCSASTAQAKCEVGYVVSASCQAKGSVNFIPGKKYYSLQSQVIHERTLVSGARSCCIVGKMHSSLVPIAAHIQSPRQQSPLVPNPFDPNAHHIAQHETLGHFLRTETT